MLSKSWRNVKAEKIEKQWNKITKLGSGLHISLVTRKAFTKIPNQLVSERFVDDCMENCTIESECCWSLLSILPEVAWSKIIGYMSRWSSFNLVGCYFQSKSDKENFILKAVKEMAFLLCMKYVVLNYSLFLISFYFNAHLC